MGTELRCSVDCIVEFEVYFLFIGVLKLNAPKSFRMSQAGSDSAVCPLLSSFLVLSSR